MKFPLPLLSLFCLLLGANALFAQPDNKALDRYCEQAQKDWNVPGMSVGVIKDGQVVLAKGYGVAEAGKTAKADENTLFAIASNTKAFVSTSLAMLVEEGKLKWDDPVQKHLPGFKLYDPYVTAHTTVRDLLCHRVGLGTFSGDVVWYKSNYSAEEVVRRAGELPQAYEYRGGYGYSNLMFIAAGEVIRAVSGKSWDVFASERILKPLGMTRTITSVKALPQSVNVAAPHKPQNGVEQPIPWVDWDNMGAAGGIISSTSDMLKWLQWNIDQGKVEGKSLLPAKALWELWQTHSINRIGESGRKLFPTRNFSMYGLGWGLFDYNGHLVVSHSGGYDGMYSRTFFVPDLKLGGVILTNSMTGVGNALMYHVLDTYTGKADKDWSKELLGREKAGQTAHEADMKALKDKRVIGTKPSLAPEKYAGLYRCKFYGDIRVSADNGKLAIKFMPANGLSATLSHWHFDTFELKWAEPQAWFDFGTVQFVLDNTGEPQELQFQVPNGDIFFEEIKAVKVD
jgi:CubicO group peptidase (beta-lactamase class C family)